MQEETAFLQAMLDNPSDLVLRLVFADWLEEQGSRRGELLRLTHILTQSMDVPRRAELEARAQTLVDEGVPAVGPFWRNSLGMRFAWIPPGTFLMGSPDNEEDREPDETQHRVSLTKGFFMGIHPVTQAQWKANMHTNRSRVAGNQHPVVRVSWIDCHRFCERLSVQTGKDYRLPTEAEWEYACRAGTTTAYHFGNSADKLHEYALFNAVRPDPVGRKKANAWGLHDMHGNVWEWCQDEYGQYPMRRVTDPQGPSTGAFRVLRGGAWHVSPANMRCATRYKIASFDRSYSVGFRICFSVS